MIRIALISLVPVFFLAFVRADDPTPANLDGRWVARRLQINGAEEDEKAVKTFRVNVFEGELIFRPGGVVTRRTTYRLDPTTSPKTVELTVHEDDKPDQTVKGIYAFENGIWKMCVPNFDRDVKGPPREFKTAPGDGLVLMELRRLTPKKQE
jgi:uncharacterized protein (TIGR03067 family)